MLRERGAVVDGMCVLRQGPSVYPGCFPIHHPLPPWCGDFMGTTTAGQQQRSGLGSARVQIEAIS